MGGNGGGRTMKIRAVVPFSLFAMSLAILPEIAGQARQTPGGVRFAPATTIPSGNYPYGIVSGNFNHDGIPDLAVDLRKVGAIAVALGQGDGTFGPWLTTRANSSSIIAAGNFDGQNLGLAVNNANGPDGVVLQGVGNGYFSGGALINVKRNGIFGFAVGDFNGDHNEDLAMTNGTRTVYVYLGNGDGTFRGRRSYPAGGNGGSCIIAGDFNGDGVTDLAVLNTDLTRTGIAVLPGIGNGKFGAPIVFHFPSDFTLERFASADFNGDHVLDLAVTGFRRGGDKSGVFILLGNGDGTFTEALRYGAGPGAFTIATGDFNGDGKIDLAVGDNNTVTFAGYVSVLLGNGDGTFQPPATFPTKGLAAGQMAIADFNGDGKPDIAVVDTDSAEVSILLNKTPFPATKPPVSPAKSASKSCCSNRQVLIRPRKTGWSPREPGLNSMRILTLKSR
jgi:hypothetical protein